MSHLTSADLVDALDGMLAPRPQQHLSACADCQEQLADMRALWRETQTVEISEPSPLFWDRLSERVRVAIDKEPDAGRRVGKWFEWPVLVPMAALALLLVAAASLLPAPVVLPARQEGATAALPSAEPALAGTVVTDDGDTEVPNAEEQWALMMDLVGDLDYETAQEAGIATGPGSAEAAVAMLSVSEQEELLRLLREEVGS